MVTLYMICAIDVSVNSWCIYLENIKKTAWKKKVSQNDPARVESVHLGDVAKPGYPPRRVDHVVESEGGERAEDKVPEEPLNCRFVVLMLLFQS